jgi:hypothetical protein
MHWLKKHPLQTIIIVGLLVRIGFICISNHIYYPDELYQSIEQSFRLVHGYGIVPWDVVYGIRSYLLPVLLAIPLFIAQLLHISNPAIYRFFVQLPLIIWSLTLIPANYLVIKKITKNTPAGLFAAFLTAIWYELVYFAPRGLTEFIAVYSFATAVIFFMRSKPKMGWGTFFLVSGCLFRPHYFYIGLILTGLFLRPKHYVAIIIGGLSSLLLFGFVDQWFMGTFFISFVNNLRLNFAAGISERFGVQYWWFYLILLGMASSGLAWIALIPPKKAAARLLWLTYICTIGIHMLFPHKEYRFIFASIPLWTALIAHTCYTIQSKKRFRFVTWKILTVGSICITILGFATKLPYQSFVYDKPIIYRDPDIAIYTKLHQDSSLCGLYDVTRAWVYTPGYFYLNQSIPYYTADYPPPSMEMVSHFIVPKSDQDYPGMTRVFSTDPFILNEYGKSVTYPGYTIYKNNQATCQSDPSYSRFRYFDAVQSVLESVHAQPILHETN